MIKVDLNQLSRTYQELVQCKRKLQKIMLEVQQSRRDLMTGFSGFEELAYKLSVYEEQMWLEVQQLDKLMKVLEQSYSIYATSEQRIEESENDLENRRIWEIHAIGHPMLHLRRMDVSQIGNILEELGLTEPEGR